MALSIMPLKFFWRYVTMKKFIHIYIFTFIVVLIIGFNVKAYGLNLVNTDYMHEFEEDINNIVDYNEDTYFILRDFTNYLEFKVESPVKYIEMILDSTDNDYIYDIYESKDGYYYDKVSFNKSILSSNEELLKLNIEGPFIRIRFKGSKSKDFVHIKDIRFLNDKKEKVNNIDIFKEEPIINEYRFYEKNIDPKESINSLISRVLGAEYVNFFNVELSLEDKGVDYFTLESKDGKINIKGNSLSSLSSALNYYIEHYLNETYDRFGDTKIKVTLPLKEIEEPIYKEIDMKYRYNYNYVSYGYTKAYWDFDKWEREIDWMALNGFNMALNLVGHEEVVRRFLSSFGFSFSEITSYLTSPVYLPWQFMGNIKSIGGEMTPKWFEDRSKLSIDISYRMRELGITPVHQTFIGYFDSKENSGVKTFEGSYWGGIKGPDRIDFNNNDVYELGRIFYEKQKELLGDTKYFAGDLFHEGGNSYGYNVSELSNKVLDILKTYEGDDSIWMIQSWGFSPSSESIKSLNKDNILILDLHSQLNVKWTGVSKFNNMSWDSPEFDGSNWIFGILNNFGGRPGLYGHSYDLIGEFYKAKEGSRFLSGIGGTSEALGFNNFIDELSTELIFKDKINMDEFIERYVLNRYGDKDLIDGFKILINTVYSPVSNVYHEGSSESIINARPSLDIKSASKWGSIHKNYDSKELERAFKIYLSMYDKYKHNKRYINDLIDISSEVIVNFSYEHYENIKEAYKNNDIETLKSLRDKFLYLISLQSNILSYNDKKSLSLLLSGISPSYDDYFRDNLIYNKKTLLTTWYDKVASEDNGLRDYANTDFYDVIGTLYYKRWERFLDKMINGEFLEDSNYEDYRFDTTWIYDLNSLDMSIGNKTLHDLFSLLLVEINMHRNDFSFLSDLIYSINKG